MESRLGASTVITANVIATAWKDTTEAEQRLLFQDNGPLASEPVLATCEVRNARTIENATLATCGFTVLHHTSTVSDWLDVEAVASTFVACERANTSASESHLSD